MKVSKAMKVSKSVGKADNACKMILLRWIRSSFEFIDLEAKECIQCSSFNVCSWRRWRCPRASERQTTIAKWSFYVGSDHHVSSLTWKQRNVFNVHHLMSGCWRRWSCPRPSERLQNDSFMLDQIIIWVHWLGSKGMINVHHLMSVVGGDEGVQDRPKGMQVDLFTLNQTIIWVHAFDLGAKECIQCSSSINYNVCFWRPWRCPRPWERQTMIASLPFASFTRFFFVSLLALQVKSYGVARLLGTGLQASKPRQGAEKIVPAVKSFTADTGNFFY